MKRPHLGSFTPFRQTLLAATQSVAKMVNARALAFFLIAALTVQTIPASVYAAITQTPTSTAIAEPPISIAPMAAARNFFFIT